MLGENVDIKKASPQLIESLYKRTVDQKIDQRPLVIGVYGESGSGKSVIARALAEKLQNHGFHSFVIQMDDYFVATPKEISRRRSENLDVVGPEEVELNLLAHHIGQIKEGATDLVLPQVNFKEDTKNEVQIVFPQPLDFVLVEGTYVGSLESIDLKVFISRTYKDTHIHRTARMREPQTDLIERVLEKEHQIVQTLAKEADIVVNKEFEVVE